jgi:translation initiation factor IF-3
MIRIPQVRVVDEEGAQLGVMPTPQALAMAQERGYDLVEVAPMASPPVVKFLDFGQYKYELTKREKDNKRRQRSVSFKEVRLTPKIGSGDFDTKVHRAIEFLEDGDRIKVTVRFRGRELTHPELGRAMLARFTDRIKEHGTPERAPLLEGKSMHLTVASLHKPKEHEAPVRPPKGHQPEAEAGAQAPAQAAAEPSEKTEPTARTEPKTDGQPAPTPATATEPAPAAPAIERAQAPKPEPTPEQEPTKAATPTPESDPGTTEEPSQEEPAKPKPERPKAAASAAPGSAANGTARSQSAPRAPQRTTNDTPAEPAATGE